MPSFHSGTDIAIPQYGVLLKELNRITQDKKVIANKMAVALRYAMKPTLQQLERNVNKVGMVSGNLRRAVSQKVKKYPVSGNAVGLVGYFAAGRGKKKPDAKGRDKAYHQHLVEYGTKPRKTASNANRGRMPVGGSAGFPPLADAYRDTIGQVNNRLIDKSTKVINSLMKQLQKAKGR